VGGTAGGIGAIGGVGGGAKVVDHSPLVPRTAREGTPG
jgi:hypothetical protein